MPSGAKIDQDCCHVRIRIAQEIVNVPMASYGFWVQVMAEATF